MTDEDCTKLACLLRACAEDAKRPTSTPHLGPHILHNQPAAIISLANAIEHLANAISPAQSSPSMENKL